MQSITNANFGPLIAYFVQGATALFGISEFSPALRSWLAVAATDAPTSGADRDRAEQDRQEVASKSACNLT